MIREELKESTQTQPALSVHSVDAGLYKEYAWCSSPISGSIGRNGKGQLETPGGIN